MSVYNQKSRRIGKNHLRLLKYTMMGMKLCLALFRFEHHAVKVAAEVERVTLGKPASAKTAPTSACDSRRVTGGPIGVSRGWNSMTAMRPPGLSSRFTSLRKAALFAISCSTVTARARSAHPSSTA